MPFIVCLVLASGIATISEQLHRKIQGLRGFHSSNLKSMRVFYEEWKIGFTHHYCYLAARLKPACGSNGRDSTMRMALLTTISRRSDIQSAGGPKRAMPIGRKPEYIEFKSPKIRPCIFPATFSCKKVVVAV